MSLARALRCHCGRLATRGQTCGVHDYDSREPTPVGPRELEIGRRVLAGGGTLQAAAIAAGVGSSDLDRAMWNRLGSAG